MPQSAIVVDTDDLDSLWRVLNRRATHMVENLTHLGVRSADDYAQAGGRHAKGQPSRYVFIRRPGRRVIRRVRHATGAQDARMIEHLAYHAFLDFFGPW